MQNYVLYYIKAEGTGCCSGPMFGTHTQPPPRECLSIEIPRNDRLYNAPNHNRGQVVNCLRFIRSQFELKNGVREAINFHTHWMDMSQVYGNSLDHAKKLRSYSRGLTAVSTVSSMPGRQFMKQMCCDDKTRTCCLGSTCACFETGRYIKQDLGLS